MKQEEKVIYKQVPSERDWREVFGKIIWKIIDKEERAEKEEKQPNKK